MTDMMPRGYTHIPDHDVPAGLVFTTPRRHQGQIVQTSYARPSDGEVNYDADYGDEYVQVTDRSIPDTQYGRRVHRPEWYDR